MIKLILDVNAKWLWCLKIDNLVMQTPVTPLRVWGKPTKKLVVSITCFSALYIGHLVLFLLFLIILSTQCFPSFVPLLLVFVLVPCYILLSFDIILHPGFVHIILSFLFTTSSWFTSKLSFHSGDRWNKGSILIGQMAQCNKWCVIIELTIATC